MLPETVQSEPRDDENPMTCDEALELLGDCADGFGPEADKAFDIVHDELVALRKVAEVAKEFWFFVHLPEQDGIAARLHGALNDALCDYHEGPATPLKCTEGDAK